LTQDGLGVYDAWSVVQCNCSRSPALCGSNPPAPRNTHAAGGVCVVIGLLLLIGFVAGAITAVSPCVLPVLPIVLAGGAAGERRRPYAIIAGLIASFTVFTLTATALLSALGLPQDTLRNAAIALLFLLAASLLVPRIGLLIEAPFARLGGRRGGGELGGGFVLGVSLGLVFVPCAGPVLATVTVLAAQHRIGFETVLLTLFYALGAGVVLLLVAIGGQRVAKRLRAGRRWFRPALGAIMAGAAFAIVFNLDQTLQTDLGSYTSVLQRHTEQSSAAASRLASLRGGGGLPKPRPSKQPNVNLPDYGTAPNFQGIADWLNTPSDRPLSIGGLRGKVVLVDFWTHSCINCLRTLPHLRAWYSAYHRYGLQIVGVHTPEFAFEHVLSNVRDAVGRLGVTWPVALDNNYSTWTAYANQYWPADYLVDKTGQIRSIHFGEGDYANTESEIRALLGLKSSQTSTPDLTTPVPTTPETYLGPDRLDRGRLVNAPVVTGRPHRYTLAPALSLDSISYGGQWTLSGQMALAGTGARLELEFHASNVYIVLGGNGRVTTLLDGKPLGSIAVTQDRLYTVFSSTSPRIGRLELRFTSGVQAYSFTFG
jgi:cytochrome c biogenesis protein CcdA/thiol-disulfide isomerase/thioredoxin